MTDGGQQQLVEESTRHMQAGIALLQAGDPVPALPHFDAAIALRERLPWQSDGFSAWLLAAAWLNRGDSLHRSGDRSLLPQAIASFDRTITAMNRVPLEGDPGYPERLILAWINRATCCGEAGDPEAALSGFATAEELLDRWGRGVTPTRSFLEAMWRVNRSRVLLETRHPRRAWEDTRRAVEILKPLHASSALIKAWSIQCRCLALLLEETGGEELPDDWIARATDAADAALALVKTTGYLDVWVADLVRYGARIYRVCQPRFLGEFLCDWLVDGPLSKDLALRQEMHAELLLAQADLEQRVLAASQESDYVQGQILVLKSFQAAAEKLSFK